METNYSRLFYMGIAYGAYPEQGVRLIKTGLPIKKLEREYPYFLGAGHRAVGSKAVSRASGKLQIYHALLPEYCGKTFFAGKPKNWKKETAGRLLGEVKERAMVRWECREQLLAPELLGKSDEIPQELWAVCLYRCRPFDRIYISLEEENGEYGMRKAVELLLPYLPRLRQVTYVGEESDTSFMLESWLYEEFGIVMMRTDRKIMDLPWLDLREEKIEESIQANDDNFRHINRWEALKFLDTAVKNGYNTKVN